MSKISRFFVRPGSRALHGNETVKGARVRFDKILLNKRQRFVGAVAVLTILLFLSENLLGRASIAFVFFLAILTDIFLAVSIYKDLKENFSIQAFILPFLFTLSSGLFYFDFPPRQIFRIFLAVLYAVGLYSLFLAENIFIVASMRTIALLSSARIVAFIISLLSFLFLTYTIFTLRLPVYATALLILLESFLFIIPALWTITLEREIRSYITWAFVLGLGLAELGLVLSFWPNSSLWPEKPVFVTLFLSGYFYILVAISQIWLSRRLFRGALWEYLWVGVFVLAVLILFTSWG